MPVVTFAPRLRSELGPAASVTVVDLGTRREVEAYFEKLNASSPVAHRQVARWGSSGQDTMQVRAVPMPERFAELGTFLGESRTPFAMDIEARREAPASVPYAVGLVIEGSMRVQGACGERVALPGQGVIVNPAEIERTWLEADTHLVEFMLPKAPMLSLSAEWAPGSLTGVPRFEPLLSAALTQRLLFMAREAAASISKPDRDGSAESMFRRWLELISLTLLHEQPIENAVKPRLAGSEPLPGAVRRALDFIEANAEQDILLGDIASAASLSVSSLGRLFNRHLGQSPAALLRDLRLDRVRDELRRGTPTSIRELAQRWGFQSPSQFSQAYQRRFGEKPSDARSRG